MHDMDFALTAFLDTHETVVKLNVITGETVFLKHAEGNIPLNVPLPRKEADAFFLSTVQIHPDDLYKTELLFTRSALKKRSDENQGGTLFSMRQFINGEYVWNRIMISVPHSYSAEDPCILLYRRILPLWESDQEEALAVYQQKIHKILKFNFTLNTFRILKQRPSEEYIRRRHSRKNVLSEVWGVEEGLIHPDDLPQFRHFTDTAFILNFFQDGNDELIFFYRRKIGSFFRWVRCSITRSTEYDIDNRAFLFIIEDIDIALTNLLDRHGSFQYNHLKSAQSDHEEIYYDNLLRVLSYFTQKYIDFYMVDLKKDLYIMYKIRQEHVSGIFPYVGTYSELAQNFILNRLSSDQKERLLPMASISALQERLMDKASIEFRFRHVNGQPVKTICTKIESLNGLPSKIICCTIPDSTEQRMKVRTFGNFEVYDAEGKTIHFRRRQAKELLAYLIDRQGYPVSSQDIIQDIFEKENSDLNAVKYVSTLYRSAVKDLEAAGYPDMIVKEWNSLRIDPEKIDCDYYHLLHGDASYLNFYHNEYMKEYSWAEETNAEILHYSSR